MNKTTLHEIILHWVLFHSFSDDCGYPLISPSDVVIDDLEFRLCLLETHGVDTIDRESRKRWEKLPRSKGKERRLRRTDGV